MFSNKSTWGGTEVCDLSQAFKAMEKMGRPKFSDEVSFVGRQRDYPAFMDYVTTAFTAKRIQHLLTEDKTVIPPKFHIPEHPPLNMLGPWESFRAEMVVHQCNVPPLGRPSSDSIFVLTVIILPLYYSDRLKYSRVY